MKKQTMCTKMLVVLMAVGGVLGLLSADAASIAVSNHSFESGLTSWTLISNFNVHSSDNGLDPRPDGTSNNAFTNGGQLYQELGTAVQANTRYTLTVDIGKRSDQACYPDQRTDLRLGVGSTYGENLLLLTAETRPVPGTGWQVWIMTFESGSSPATGNLRIELIGTQQSQFDNVRLDAVASSFNPSSPWEAYVRNHTFEYWQKAFWLGNLGGPFDTSSSAVYDPTPDPDDTEYHMFSNGVDGYQVLDSMPLEADTTYTLTVDVGDRTDHSFGGAELRMGTGSTYGNNLLDATVVSSTTPVNGVGASDGWETWVSTFTTGSGIVGDPLRIELVNPGGIQTLWDNVRLSVTPPRGSGMIFSIR